MYLMRSQAVFILQNKCVDYGQFTDKFNSAMKICAVPKAQDGREAERTASQAGRRRFEPSLPLQLVPDSDALAFSTTYQTDPDIE